jgi:N-methylhydantoinase A
MIRIGTDIGGTFTDIVWVDDQTGEIKADKAPTTPADVVQGVMAAYAKAGVTADEVGQFIHGSTVATNALVTQRGAVTGLITTKGFRDILEIRRIDRPDEHIYNIFWEKPKPLVPRRRRLEISARMMFDGTVLEPVDEAEVRAVTERLLEAGVQSIAVCLLHAYADPSHELAVRDLIREIDPDVYVSMSHEVAREIREYERTSSTVIDAYVKKPVVGYLNRLDTTLRDDTGLENSPLIANSSGGVSTVEAIGRAPIQMMESGPAGGAIGAAYLAEKLGTPNLVTGDVGGTSYDVSIVVDGQTVLRTEHDILGYAAKVSSIDVRSVGAGGGSIARVDSGGRLHVGPASAGADPGPMCYDRGGEEPTVTDAAVVTGLIDPTLFAGGEMKLRPELASKGIEPIARELGLTTEETAEGILTVARNNMANVTRQTLVGQGHDPRDFALLAFGGGGGLFASEVARTLDIPKVIIPRHPSVFSAWGMLSADIVGSFARSYLRQIPQVELDYVQRLFAEMEAEALELTSEAGVEPGNVTFHRSIDCRYTGQGHEVEVPLGELPIDENLIDLLPDLFDEVHEARFGHRMPSQRETVTYRLRVFGTMHRLPLVEIGSGPDSAKDALVSTKKVFVNRRWQDAGIYDRGKLLGGATLEGPALVQEPSHVSVLMPGDTATVDAFGALHISVGSDA